jgi:hypothetical protein
VASRFSCGIALVHLAFSKKVLHFVHAAHSVRQLCDKTTISQATGRDFARSFKFQRYDSIHRERREPQVDDEPVEGQEQKYSI